MHWFIPLTAVSGVQEVRMPPASQLSVVLWMLMETLMTSADIFGFSPWPQTEVTLGSRLGVVLLLEPDKTQIFL